MHGTWKTFLKTQFSILRQMAADDIRRSRHTVDWSFNFERNAEIMRHQHGLQMWSATSLVQHFWPFYYRQTLGPFIRSLVRNVISWFFQVTSSSLWGIFFRKFSAKRQLRFPMAAINAGSKSEKATCHHPERSIMTRSSLLFKFSIWKKFQNRWAWPSREQ